MTISIIKLSSGEQIVGKIIDYGELAIYIKHPLLLIRARDGSGNHFMDHWLPVYSGSFEVQINNQTVITCVDADEWLINFYNKMIDKFTNEEPVSSEPEKVKSKETMPEEFYSQRFLNEGIREYRSEKDKTQLISNKDTFH